MTVPLSIAITPEGAAWTMFFDGKAYGDTITGPIEKEEIPAAIYEIAESAAETARALLFLQRSEYEPEGPSRAP